MLALVALPRIFFIFASFFSVLVPPSPLLSLSPLSFLSLSPSTGHSCTGAHSDHFNHLIFLPLAKLLEPFELEVAVAVAVAIGLKLGLPIEASAFTVS